MGNSPLFIGKAESVFTWPDPLAHRPALLSLRGPPLPIRGPSITGRSYFLSFPVEVFPGSVLSIFSDVEDVGDLTLEAMEDIEVVMVDGVFEGAFRALGDESLELEAFVDAMEVMVVDDE
ncbi:hypothetical protein Tco_0777333 [Tanacetum coccineum]